MSAAESSGSMREYAGLIRRRWHIPARAVTLRLRLTARRAVLRAAMWRGRQSTSRRWLV